MERVRISLECKLVWVYFGCEVRLLGSDVIRVSIRDVIFVVKKEMRSVHGICSIH